MERETISLRQLRAAFCCTITPTVNTDLSKVVNTHGVSDRYASCVESNEAAGYTPGGDIYLCPWPIFLLAWSYPLPANLLH